MKKALQRRKPASSEFPAAQTNLTSLETIEQNSIQPQYLVPYSKWIVIEPAFCSYQEVGAIPLATLVFHSVMSFSTYSSAHLLRESSFTPQDEGASK